MPPATIEVADQRARQHLPWAFDTLKKIFRNLRFPEEMLLFSRYMADSLTGGRARRQRS